MLRFLSEENFLELLELFYIHKPHLFHSPISAKRAERGRVLQTMAFEGCVSARIDLYFEGAL